MGFVDEYRIILQPVLLGSGSLLFKDIHGKNSHEALISKGFWFGSGSASLRASLTKLQRGNYEQGSGSGGHAQRRIHSNGRRQARQMGRQRAAFCRMGTVSPEGIARRSEPAVCVAIERMVRAVDPALGRWRQDLVPAWNAARGTDCGRPSEGREQQVRLRCVCRNRQAAHHAPVL